MCRTWYKYEKEVETRTPYVLVFIARWQNSFPLLHANVFDEFSL